jgi:putative membrane protein insertion efficiency factor
VSLWNTPPRRLVLGFLLAGIALLAVDLARPPAAQVTTRAALATIDLYQATLSPRFERLGARCRFRPTCSHYGEAVIRRHGIIVGGAKAAWRILRCGPWTPAGTEDPPDPS